MKKYFITFISLALLILSCQKNTNDYAVISGEITNSDNKIIKILDVSGKEIHQINIVENGLFSDTVFNIDGFYTLLHGRQHTPLYLENGYELNITADAQDYKTSIIFSGKGAEPNNYLREKNIASNAELGNRQELYGLDEDSFLTKNIQFEKELHEKLKELPKIFVEREKKTLTYEKALRLMLYELMHRNVTQNHHFSVSSNFPDPLVNISLDNNEEFTQNSAYRNLVSNYFTSTARNISQQENISYTKALAKELQSMAQGEIKETMMKNVAYLITMGNNDNDELYNIIVNSSNDAVLKEELTSRMEKFRLLAKGNNSPSFENYENYKGGTTSLSNFNGKYVYIDVWATWCGPCKAEIPHMKELEKKYHGKNIEFVSISIDKVEQKDAWKQMIKDKKMGGVQLFADKDWNSDFIKNYGITGIPQFILLDPSGKIISADAPRPSNKKAIENLFDESGI